MSITRKILAAAGAVTDTGAWDIANASYGAAPLNSFSVLFQDANAQDVFFKPDGTKMYMIGYSSDTVHEYNLSTAWDVSTASYVQGFSISAQDGVPYGLFFKPDGTKMYVLGDTNRRVYEYNLSTAWDVSTASYSQDFSVAGNFLNPHGVFFKPDGTKMFVTGDTRVYGYNLTTAWDVSTAGYNSQLSIGAQASFPTGAFFKPDGTKMYVVDASGDKVIEYNLSTSWSISSASYSQVFSVVSQAGVPTGVFFKPDGTKMYISDNTNDSIFQYDLSTAWDVSTASYSYPTKDFLSVAAQETDPKGVFFKPDGTKMFIVGNTGNDITEWQLSTPWNVTSATYWTSFSVASQEFTPTDVYFSPGGTIMYVTGDSGNDVSIYGLNTAWDISSTYFWTGRYIGSQESVPQGIFFKPDGTKMYIVGTNRNTVYEYNLSPGWTGYPFYYDSFSVSSQTTYSNSITFKPDGTKMYVLGYGYVYQYALGTAWRVSTASYEKSFYIGLEVSFPSGIYFREDGAKMFIVDSTKDNVVAYDVGFSE